MLVNRALAVDIVRASARRHRHYIFCAHLRRQIHQLRRGNEQAMVEFAEITALPASPAHPGQVSLVAGLRVQPVVDFTHLIYDSAVVFHLPTTS